MERSGGDVSPTFVVRVSDISNDFVLQVLQVSNALLEGFSEEIFWFVVIWEKICGKKLWLGSVGLGVNLGVIVGLLVIVASSTPNCWPNFFVR